MRKTFSLFLLASIALIAPVVKADTIHLKNGSIIKGKVTSFADDQFVVMLDTGSGRYISRAMIYIGDVARIEFDSSGAAPTDTTTSRDTSPGASSGDTSLRDTGTSIRRTDPPVTDAPREETPRDTSAAQPASPATREPEPAPVDRNTGTTTAEVSDTNRPPRKLEGPVRSATIDVAAKRDWTSTGLIIKRGDFVRITATGSVVIDPASGQTSGPEGINLADTRKLMQDQATGALIAVIGADNDDFIFVGRSVEFTATRDGLLFLSVNEGALSDNTGSYKALVEVQAQRAR